MFRSAALALVVASASALTEDQFSVVSIAFRSCYTTYRIAIDPRKTEGGDPADCDAILGFETCLLKGNGEFGLQNLDLDDAVQAQEFKYQSSRIEKSRRDNTFCAFNNDLRFETSDTKLGELFTFKREKYSFFDMAELLQELEEDTMTIDAADKAIDALIAKAKDARTELAVTTRDTKLQLEETAVTNKIALEEKLAAIKRTIDKKLEQLTDDIESDTSSLAEETDVKLNTLSADIKGKLATYEKKQPWPNATSDPRYYAQYEFIMAETAPSNTENGHAGRIMYKVNFNPNLPGFWYPGGEELKQACRALSNDLKSIDGIDRDLKPAADVDWASDGDSVQLTGSYLSNCGCGGHPRQRQCVGMSRTFLTGGAMYNRYHSWNGCQYLRHDGRDCHHHWSDCYQRRGVRARFTICTSANANKGV